MNQVVMSAAGLVLCLAMANPVEARGGHGGGRNSYSRGRSSYSGSRSSSSGGQYSSKGKATGHYHHSKRYPGKSYGKYSGPRYTKAAFLAKYGTRFSKGYLFKGKAALQYFKYRRWDARYRRYCWWCPYVGGWYYWYGTTATFYPVEYTPPGAVWSDGGEVTGDNDADNACGDEAPDPE